MHKSDREYRHLYAKTHDAEGSHASAPRYYLDTVITDKLEIKQDAIY